MDLKMPATFPAREGGIMCMCSVELEAWPVLSAGPSIIVRRLQVSTKLLVIIMLSDRSSTAPFVKGVHRLKPITKSDQDS